MCVVIERRINSMGRILFFNLLGCFLMLALIGCSNQDTGPSAGVAVVSGFVKDASSRTPLAGVLVEGKAGTDVVVQTTTNAQGAYELRLSIDSAMTAKITIRNFTGYRDTSEIVVSVRPNEAAIRDIDLNPKSQVVGSGGSGSGLAQTVAFLGANPTQVSVYGVGGQETSVLGFEARDSLGLPVDGAHAVTITFSLVGGPNGGEYISPSTLTTNAVGRAYIAFNSGTRSGVVQVFATATIGSRTIASAPVRIVINAGFADQTHFTLAPEKRNFPTWGVAGNRLKVNVIVGDRYSNPVVQNTAVYFRSNAGVVQPAVFTSADGLGTADLISGNPSPSGQYAAPNWGEGYHYVVARTIGQGGTTVQDSVLILWSAHAEINNVVPQTFDVPNGQYQDFSFKVSDFHGNPLAAGTSITVTKTTPPPPPPPAVPNEVQLAFGREGVITLNDVIQRGSGSTDFVFRLSDGTPGLDSATPTAISISVAGPNGNAYYTLNGVVR
jgi:hypothetical protein